MKTLYSQPDLKAEMELTFVGIFDHIFSQSIEIVFAANNEQRSFLLTLVKEVKAPLNQ